MTMTSISSSRTQEGSNGYFNLRDSFESQDDEFTYILKEYKNQQTREEEDYMTFSEEEFPLSPRRSRYVREWMTKSEYPRVSQSHFFWGGRFMRLIVHRLFQTR